MYCPRAGASHRVGTGCCPACTSRAPHLTAVSVRPPAWQGKSAVPQFEPGHRPPAAPPPAPPRGQPRHEPEPPSAFRVISSRTQLRHPMATAIGDLNPDNAGAGRDRHRDRLPGQTRAAIPHAIAEKLAHEQDSVIPARVPRAEHRAHERADNPRTLHPSGNPNALPDRRPSHQHTRLPARRKDPQGRERTHGEMHAHLSRQRQAKYAPGGLTCRQATSCARPARMLPVKTRASRARDLAGQ
jgi:hypothetical protein